MWSQVNIVILDGYIDEPSNLGVRPYISPLVRYMAGAAWASGEPEIDVTYIDIDTYRGMDPKRQAVAEAEVLVVVAGVTVPGKYVRGRPASPREVLEIARGSKAGMKLLAGDMARFSPIGRMGEELDDAFDQLCKNDGDAALNHYLGEGNLGDCRRTREEWDHWSVAGAPIVTQHPDFPRPLMVEVDLFKGCPRALDGGCSFCTEPLRGKVEHRDAQAVAAEMGALARSGAVNYRLACSCIYCYDADISGPEPIPRPERVLELFEAIQAAVPAAEVLHVDNADPGVIANNLEEARTITSILVKYCTPGNALSFGLECADPAVIEANNLNSNPAEVMDAVALVNSIGKERGRNGMPMLLPGINFLAGLAGETSRSFDMDLELLRSILKAGHLLRRINIRQVSDVRGNLPDRPSTAKRSDFMRFKDTVRKEIDRVMLERMLPRGTVLRALFLEHNEGKTRFARQAGTYPILVGIPYLFEQAIHEPFDVCVTDWGFRSVTAVTYPMDVNKVPMSWLSALPCVGKKRAARMVRARPFKDPAALDAALDDKDVAKAIMQYLAIGELDARDKSSKRPNR